MCDQKTRRWLNLYIYNNMYMYMYTYIYIQCVYNESFVVRYIIFLYFYVKYCFLYLQTRPVSNMSILLLN